MNGSFHIELYSPSIKKDWDAFLDGSKNGTFLFRRDYMDYHSDRFTDMSLVVRHEEEGIIAILPGNVKGNRYFSHQGLTYGGLISDGRMTTALCLAIFKEIRDFLAARGITSIRYKTVPHIYHRILADEDLYAVFRMNGQLVFRGASVAIDLDNPLRMGRSRINAIKRARKNGVEVRESDDLKAFYEIMCRNMSDRYHAVPTHSLAELEMLRKQFPDQIRLFNAYKDGEVLAGALVFDCGRVLHTQYTHSSPEGKKNGALDLTIEYLADMFRGKCKYLDFGKSSDCDGWFLNETLIYQKEGFGARAVMYDWYDIPVTMTPEISFSVKGSHQFDIRCEEKNVGSLKLIPGQDGSADLMAEIMPDFLKRGIGHRVVEYAEKKAREAGMNSLRNETSDNRTIALLREHGFEEFPSTTGSLLIKKLTER